MKIQLIRNKSCHIWQTTEKVLKEALSEARLPEEYEIVVVKNDEEAKKYHFYGSPQVTINDKDIDPIAEKATQFQVEGCRIYLYEGKMYEYPPKEMIVESLKKVGDKYET
mgnify:CR=1 FL=1